MSVEQTEQEPETISAPLASIDVSTVNSVTMALIEDYDKLRKGDITNTDARVRAQLAREILRSLQVQLQGLTIIQDSLPSNSSRQGEVDGTSSTQEETSEPSSTVHQSNDSNSA